ncbi:MAG: NAD-dependent epimerase/dehydratase family protein [Candidatus Eremiobacteraeota bacterium]|nr:NAD-dependent epimerase/dehydratase family protein [Candidatus Eremiobacteraeota bacterium]
MLAHTAGLWDALRGERVFITGGTGFVGTWLIEAFVAANDAYDLGATAVLLSRDPARFAERAPHLAGHPAVRLIAGDAVYFTPPEGRFAFVVHAATERQDGDAAAVPLRSLDRDTGATRRVLDFARHAHTQRMLFTSSGAVYGNQPAELSHVAETYLGAPDATDARTAYGQGKRLSEFACASYARTYELDVVIGRLFAFVGPHLPLRAGFAAGNFFADILRGDAIRIGGDGTAVRSYLYAADLAIWLWTMLLRGTRGRAYNVGSAHALSIRRLAELMVSELAPGTAIEVEHRTLAGAAGARYVPSIDLAERELGLRVRVALPDALRRTYDFYREG